jgi:hypothetical protein
METFEIRSHVWEKLFSEHWGRTAAKFSNAITGPVMTDDEVMETLRGIDFFKKSDGLHPDIRLYIDGRPVIARPDAMNFTPTGSSLQSYIDTVSDRLSGSNFCIILENTQVHCESLWHRISSVTSRLVSRVGMPFETDAVLFVGNYDTTPFGIHRDNASIFQFAIHGSKTMLLWPGFNSPVCPRMLNPKDFDESAALSYTCTEREFIYWPPHCMHIGKGVPGSLSVSLSIVYWVEEIAGNMLFKFLRDTLRSVAGTRYIYAPAALANPTNEGSISSFDEDLPEHVMEAWNRLVALLETGSGLDSFREIYRQRGLTNCLKPPPQGAPKSALDQWLTPREITVSRKDPAPHPAETLILKSLTEEGMIISRLSNVAEGDVLTFELNIGDKNLVLQGEVVEDSQQQTCIFFGDMGHVERELLVASIDGQWLPAESIQSVNIPLEWKSNSRSGSGRTIHLGMLGMMVQTDQPPEVGDLVEFVFDERVTTGDAADLSVNGRVIYRRDHAFSVVFVDASRKLLSALLAFP